MERDSRRTHRPARFRADGPLPQHYPDLATGEWIACIIDWTPAGEVIRTEGARFPDYLEAWEASRAMAKGRREGRSEETHHETALFAEAAALMRRAHGTREELEAATAAGVEETERLVHGATMAGIEAGLQQVAQRSLKDALEATTGLEPAWLRRLLEGLNPSGPAEGEAN